MVNKFLFTLGLAALMPMSVAITLQEGCPVEPPGEICDNGIDDDGDTFTDCQDFECVGEDTCEGSTSTCTDGADNDGDTFTDCQDYDCSQNCETAELCGATEATVEACSDGIDNDGDGYADCEDFSCSRNVCDAVRDLCATAQP